ncbi:type II toxin-antitoxin system PemK/MazF family toxin [Candidatus Halobeggiatoa sp. HSG11]|nr:type II toxin-antitoxin system PemK/MazF family toxin [Candidatus Halobeggiatoa sp. HSG11]
MVKRGEVYWVILDPTIGTEIKKTRPCLIVSPNDMNQHLPKVLVAPITSKGQSLGCRPEIDFCGKKAKILLDQIRCIDKIRLKKKMGMIHLKFWHQIMLDMLQ